MWSDCSPRLLSMDFVNRCSLKQLRDFLGSICGLERMQSMYFAYMLNAAQGTMDESRGLVVKNYLERMFGRLQYKGSNNPYAGRRGGAILDIERPFFRAKCGLDYATVINDMPMDVMMEYLRECVDRGLMIHRILQEDVFAGIDPVKQFLILNNLPGLTFHMLKGFKQLLCGGLDVEVKLKICDVMSSHKVSGAGLVATVTSGMTTSYENINSKSFNQIAMALELGGDDKICDWLLFAILLKDGLDFIKKGYKPHKALFKRYFDILEVLEHV
jgi:hypothetical protein